MKLIRSLQHEKMQRDAEILTSMQGIGDKTAFNFLIEMGGDVKVFEHDGKLIAAAGLDPTTYESGKFKGKSKISAREEQREIVMRNVSMKMRHFQQLFSVPLHRSQATAC